MNAEGKWIINTSAAFITTERDGYCYAVAFGLPLNNEELLNENNSLDSLADSVYASHWFTSAAAGRSRLARTAIGVWRGCVHESAGRYGAIRDPLAGASRAGRRQRWRVAPCAIHPRILAADRRI